MKDNAHLDPEVREETSRVAEKVASIASAAKDTYAAVQDKAVRGASSVDRLIRDNPYQSLAIALGVGALLGCLLSRRPRE